MTSMMSETFKTYYLTSGTTTRARCRVCGKAFQEHLFVNPNLHACPTNTDYVARKEVERCLEDIRDGLDSYFKIGRFACKKPLANGYVLKVEIRLPAGKACSARRRRR